MVPLPVPPVPLAIRPLAPMRRLEPDADMSSVPSLIKPLLASVSCASFVPVPTDTTAPLLVIVPPMITLLPELVNVARLEEAKASFRLTVAPVAVIAPVLDQVEALMLRVSPLETLIVPLFTKLEGLM